MFFSLIAWPWLLFFAFATIAVADPENDPGKEPVGRVTVTLIFGTNGDPAVAGNRSKEVQRGVVDKLRKAEALRFDHYRLLGTDVQPVLRSYESWAAPMRPSEEVLVRFDVQGKAPAGGLRLDLELWLQKQKVLKSAASLERHRPLYIRGPAWRGGQMILIIELKS